MCRVMPFENEVPQISTPQDGGTQGLRFCEHTAPPALSGKAPSSLRCFENFSFTFSHDTQSGGAFQKMQKIVMFSFLVYLEGTLPSIKTQQAL
jgi:hypothetical protein